MASVLIAIGGNALQLEGESPSIERQLERSRDIAKTVVTLVTAGHRITLTHGNGPQVGSILRRDELARVGNGDNPQLLDLPLWLGVADSQGGMGSMLSLAVTSALQQAGLPCPVAAVVTHCLVDQEDPAFETPTKPIGSAISADAAPPAWETIPAGAGLVRRVVASPVPKEILEAPAIAQLIRGDAVVIAAGGGGIPVIETPSGLQSVDAVIDKDLTSALLATQTGIEKLVLITGVPNVYAGWGTPNQQALGEVSAPEIRKYLRAGEFPTGSMKPKIEAALSFLDGGGREVIITNLESIDAALVGQGGTRIRK